jgi:hypothetical protein
MPIRTPPRPLPAALAPPQRPETFETASSPWTEPPPPLAEHARTLRHHAGPCAVCSYAMLAGDRVASLTGSGRAVHVACTARLAQD